MPASLSINGETVSIPEAWEESSLLEFLRDCQGLTGTKYGCGIGLCGACTVHLDGRAARACVLPATAVAGREVTTIEGLGERELHPVQQAWLENNVPQCGYCQPGQIMTAAAFLAENAAPSEVEIAAAMDNNLCRCGTYTRIRQSVARAAEIASSRA